MIKRVLLAVAASLALMAPAHAQGISQKVGVCDPRFPARCAWPDASGNLPITGTISANTEVTATAANPSYGEGSTTNPISVDLTGFMRSLAKQSGNWDIRNITGTFTTIPTFKIDQTTPGTTNAVSSAQSGTWTVQPGNTANTTAWKVDNSAVTQPVSSTTLASAAKQDTLLAALASPFQAGGALGAGTAVIGAIAQAPVTNVASTALAANLTVLGSATNLYNFDVQADSTLSAAAWIIQIYNATSAPTDGAVTPALCYPMSAGSTGFAFALPAPIAFSTGIVIGVGTGSNCFNKAASTHAYIQGAYRS